MLDYNTLMLFLFVSVALVITPGSYLLLVTTRRIAQGPGSGPATYLGIATGSYLNVIDDFSRECLAAVVDTSIGGARVARELDRIAELRGYPSLHQVGQRPMRGMIG